MSPAEVIKLGTKLDILIDDFQAHRKGSVKQEQMTEVKTVLVWHGIIGGFYISTTVGAVFMYLLK